MSRRPSVSEVLQAAGIAAVPGLPPALAGLSADSRSIRPGMLYAALPGARQDGRAFIADAVARGAAAVLAPLGTRSRAARWPASPPPRPGRSRSR